LVKGEGPAGSRVRSETGVYVEEAQEAGRQRGRDSYPELRWPCLWIWLAPKCRCMPLLSNWAPESQSGKGVKLEGSKCRPQGHRQRRRFGGRAKRSSRTHRS
jgi:hypothetical protein